MSKRELKPLTVADAVEEIQGRAVGDGGFSLVKGGPYQPDATAWAVMALESADRKEGLLAEARARLAGSQKPDGRVIFSSRLKAAYWATPLAILAWLGSQEFGEPVNRAVEFMLKTSGLHWDNEDDPIFGHDTSLRGWPWIEGTHSWVEPTALVVLALKACRLTHKRKDEAVEMILNRQLPSGGWNYGNTTVFGTELRPTPESTGVALDALSGSVDRERVSLSLEYMRNSAFRTRTPLSLSWAILGLGSWAERPQKAAQWISESLERQNLYGSYDTSLLAQLVIARYAPAGLLSGLDNPE